MMKIRLIIAGLALAISACATNLIGKETQALEAVTASRMIATQQLRAGKISRAEHARLAGLADAARDAIVAAVKANDPVAVEAERKKAEAVKAELEKL